jgi:hypothetical protein
VCTCWDIRACDMYVCVHATCMHVRNMDTCMYLYVCACVCVCVCVYVHTHAGTYLHAICTCVFAWMCVCVCVCKCTYHVCLTSVPNQRRAPDICPSEYTEKMYSRHIHIPLHTYIHTFCVPDLISAEPPALG